MVHSVDLSVGRKLKQTRKALRMSQSDVAKELGLSFQQVQKYETGANRISASCLYEMSKVLGVPVDTFFEGIEAEEETPVRRDMATEISSALAAIEDRNLQAHIVSYIRSVAATQSSSRTA